MWRITRLYLRNFIFIQSGMNRREVTLDFSECNKKINIFIGKMGSGKSSILGHLQPFADYGTLDVRNKADAIIPGEDGLKEIDFLHDGHNIEIQHVYSWNKSTQAHSTKSFIRIDGRELNENGNVSSFKELIRLHFGIDQSFLRLLRLGPNVANVINMKSTERKAFIASLLKETEVYTMLYKKLSDDQRNLNGVLTVLNNKLISLSSDKQNELKAEVDDLDDDLRDLSTQIDNLKDSISRLKGINHSLLGKLKTDLPTELERLETLQESEKIHLDDIIKSLEELPTEGVEQLSSQYAESVSKLNSIEEELLRIQTRLESNQTERNRLTDILLISDHSEQIAELEKQAVSIRNSYRDSERKLSGFEPRYSYAFLTNFITTIQSFQLSLEEMCNNPSEIIQKCFKSDGTIMSYCKKRIEIATGRQVNLQKLLSNITFAAEYRCPIPLYRPPMCPTEDCPYVTTHPETIGEMNKTLDRVSELKNQIDALDREIAIYEECAIQYPKMQFLKQNWNLVYGVLNKIGVINEHSLYTLLINLGARTNWYDQPSLMRYIEMVKLYEDFDALRKRAEEIDSELIKLKETDASAKKKDLENLNQEYESMIARMEELSNEKIQAKERKLKLSNILSNLGNREALQVEKTKLEGILETRATEIFELQTRIGQYDDNSREIRVLETKMSVINSEYETKVKRAEAIRARLQDIRSTSETYQENLEEARVLRLILSAVSSKDGIPLIMVKLFLDECKEIINDLISDIFEDNLEIVEFSISEDSNEFKIPYRINGMLVPDIEYASQGQQAVISIALSFALSQKSMSDYNIPLFDEIDDSIHKSSREKFITILYKQMRALGTEQAFLITHNDIFQQAGLPVNIIMTTPEIVDQYDNQSIMRIY